MRIKCTEVCEVINIEYMAIPLPIFSPPTIVSALYPSIVFGEALLLFIIQGQSINQLLLNTDVAPGLVLSARNMERSNLPVEKPT